MSLQNPVIEFVSSLEKMDAQQWDKIVAGRSPFLSYAFLHALEASGSVTAKHGWQANHIICYQDEQLVGVLPLYIKGHSYGEYVFDFAWANAYQQHGLDYYPKLISAIPFTPVPGTRLCLSESEEQAEWLPVICSALQSYLSKYGLSSLHWLFVEEVFSQQLAQQKHLARKSVQFHWFNREFSDFDDFLQSFSSRKRKNVKKERQKLQHPDLTIQRLTGEALDAKALDTFYSCYQQTYLKRSGHQGYLNQDFFKRIFASMASNIMLVVAEYQQRPIASALFFFDHTALYGRYWGCLEEFDGLHFECCYYQGIEFAIEQGLSSFNPGTQGEHKIARGFTPTYCYSNHWIVEPGFREPIARFLEQESEHTAAYKAEAEQLLPFKQAQQK